MSKEKLRPSYCVSHRRGNNVLESLNFHDNPTTFPPLFHQGHPPLSQNVLRAQSL